MDKPKGYYTQQGYVGLVGKRYMLFATEAEYHEYIAD